MAMIMKQIIIALIFYLVESLTTVFLLSLSGYLSKPTGQYADIDVLFRNTLVVFIMRIILMQAILEILIIFMIVRYGGWEKFILILVGVFLSAIIWGVVMGVGSGNDFSLLKAAFAGYGLPLFLGTLFSWWFCYKWIGLKA
jgi:hypothetical protein